MMENLSLDLLFHLVPFLNNKSFYALGATNRAIEKIWPWRQRLMIPPPWTDVVCQGYMNIEPGQENFQMWNEHFDIYRGFAGRKPVYYHKGHEEEVKRAWFDQFGEECPALHYEYDYSGSLKIPFDIHHRIFDSRFLMGDNRKYTFWCNFETFGESLSEIIKWLWPLIVEARIRPSADP